MRPFERSCSVAYELASTVGSRVAGFVTKWPSLIFDVSRVATASVGIDSCQSTCESYVHAYSKPCFSASWISSIIRVYGGSGRTVTPKLRLMGSPRRVAGKTRWSELRNEDHLRRPELRGACS